MGWGQLVDEAGDGGGGRAAAVLYARPATRLYDGAGTSKRSKRVDVRIGIIQTAKELDVELGPDVVREELLAEIETALGATDRVLWLTDKRGRRVAIPSSKVAYVEVGETIDDRRVGFGAP